MFMRDCALMLLAGAVEVNTLAQGAAINSVAMDRYGSNIQPSN